MALLRSSYSPDVYDCAIGEYHGTRSYWECEDAGIVTAKLDTNPYDHESFDCLNAERAA